MTRMRALLYALLLICIGLGVLTACGRESQVQQPGQWLPTALPRATAAREAAQPLKQPTTVAPNDSKGSAPQVKQSTSIDDLKAQIKALAESVSRLQSQVGGYGRGGLESRVSSLESKVGDTRGY